MSVSYTFERRRIFRRRSSWSMKANFAIVILMGLAIGYLLPELISSVGATTPSLGEPAFGQVDQAAPGTGTGFALLGDNRMDCPAQAAAAVGIDTPARTAVALMPWPDSIAPTAGPSSALR
jgi:hypothetical protein